MWFLNIKISPWLAFLKDAGSRLKSFAPLTSRLCSLALFTAAGVLLGLARGGKMAILPDLVRVSLKGMLYPETIPCDIFQMYIIWYLSLRLSWLYRRRLLSLSQYVRSSSPCPLILDTRPLCTPSIKLIWY